MGISDKPYSEKRDFIRMKISAPLNAKLSSEGQVIDGLCRDLSGGGMQVEITQEISLDAEYEVTVCSDHGHNPTLIARVKVVRVRPIENDAYLIGLEILEIIPN